MSARKSTSPRYSSVALLRPWHYWFSCFLRAGASHPHLARFALASPCLGTGTLPPQHTNPNNTQPATTNAVTVVPNRPSSRLYVRAVGRAFGSVYSCLSTASGPTRRHRCHESKAGPATAETIAAENVFKANVFEPGATGASSEQPLSTAAGKGILLDSSVRQRSGTSWYRPARMQLLAAPEQDAVSTAPAWSAIVLDGVTVPYEEVVGVRTDESKLGFIIVERAQGWTTLDQRFTQIHVRMFTRSEFNVWREAFDASIRNSTPHGAHDTESTSPTAYATAQKWLARNEADHI